MPNAELAVAVVDEAILALTGYDLPDPLTSFYGERATDMTDSHSRGYIVLASPISLGPGRQRRQCGRRRGSHGRGTGCRRPKPARDGHADSRKGGREDGAGRPPIAVRSDFNPLANWSPAVSTDAQGRASITVKVPDNLTRYRVMVVAVAGGKQFGKGASRSHGAAAADGPALAPRFLNFGDRFELPVVVQNQTDAPMTVDVAVRPRTYS